MNVLTTPHWRVIRADGSRDTIALYEIGERDNPVVEFDTPRADFRGAFHQLVIAALQTAYAPEDDEAWFALWQEPPSPAVLQQAFESIAPAFELFSSGPAFLQDLELVEGEQMPVAALLIDCPGGNTLKKNSDHFIKRETGGPLCESCVAIALYTLQTNAPSGGAGHRTGLRGGGPLTTLLLPRAENSPLWSKSWLNVLPQKECPPEHKEPPKTLPWMAATRLSDKTGQPTQPKDAHYLQAYWGMPRRIRLQRSDQEGHCTVCGAHSNNLTCHYITKNYGVNYEGLWQHPLTPYLIEPKKMSLISLKGQKGGLGYRHWLGLSLSRRDQTDGDGAAEVVCAWQSRANEFMELAEEPVRLWCFGFDMDNMKARCWYDHQMPFMAIHPDYNETFIALVTTLLSAARETVGLLRTYIKAAWFERPGDAKVDMSVIEHAFWRATESFFYQHIHTLAKLPSNTHDLPADMAAKWRSVLFRVSLNLFDEWVLAGDMEDRNMRRIAQNRKIFLSKFKKAKPLKHLAQIAGTAPAQHGVKEGER